MRRTLHSLLPEKEGTHLLQLAKFLYARRVRGRGVALFAIVSVLLSRQLVWPIWLLLVTLRACNSGH